VLAGSYRRGMPFVGDLDVLVVADAPGQLTKRFAQTCPDVANVLMCGKQRTSVVLKSGIQVDVRVVAPALLVPLCNISRDPRGIM
jgi:DNA polymerase (family 10)